MAAPSTPPVPPIAFSRTQAGKRDTTIRENIPASVITTGSSSASGPDVLMVPAPAFGQGQSAARAVGQGQGASDEVPPSPKAMPKPFQGLGGPPAKSRGKGLPKEDIAKFGGGSSGKDRSRFKTGKELSEMQESQSQISSSVSEAVSPDAGGIVADSASDMAVDAPPAVDDEQSQADRKKSIGNESRMLT